MTPEYSTFHVSGATACAVDGDGNIYFAGGSATASGSAPNRMFLCKRDAGGNNTLTDFGTDYTSISGDAHGTQVYDFLSGSANWGADVAFGMVFDPLGGSSSNGDLIIWGQGYDPDQDDTTVAVLRVNPDTGALISSFVGGDGMFEGWGAVGPGLPRLRALVSWVGSPALQGEDFYLGVKAINGTAPYSITSVVSGDYSPTISSDGSYTWAGNYYRYVYASTPPTPGDVTIQAVLEDATSTSVLSNKVKVHVALSDFSPLNAARAYHTATTLADGRIAIIGGYDGNIPALLDSIEIFDPSDGSMTTATSTLATARCMHYAILRADGKVMIFGGNDGSDSPSAFYSSTEIWDPATDTITAGTAMPVAQSRSFTTWVDRQSVIEYASGQWFVGPGFEAGMVTGNHLLTYDESGNSWASSTISRHVIDYAMVQMSSGWVLMAGGWIPSAFDPTAAGPLVDSSTTYDTGIMVDPTTVGGSLSSDTTSQMPLTVVTAIIGGASARSRVCGSAHLQPDGTVLVIGGFPWGPLLPPGYAGPPNWTSNQSLVQETTHYDENTDTWTVDAGSYLGQDNSFFSQSVVIPDGRIVRWDFYYNSWSGGYNPKQVLNADATVGLNVNWGYPTPYVPTYNAPQGGAAVAAYAGGTILFGGNNGPSGVSSSTSFAGGSNVVVVFEAWRDPFYPGGNFYGNGT